MTVTYQPRAFNCTTEFPPLSLSIDDQSSAKDRDATRKISLKIFVEFDDALMLHRPGYGRTNVRLFVISPCEDIIYFLLQCRANHVADMLQSPFRYCTWLFYGVPRV